MKKAKKRISAQESRGALFDSISGRNPAIKESNSDLEEDFIRINLQNREFFYHNSVSVTAISKEPLSVGHRFCI